MAGHGAERPPKRPLQGCRPSPIPHRPVRHRRLVRDRPPRRKSPAAAVARYRASGSLFHEATRHIERPPFLDTRTDPWSVGDRVAWGDVQVADLERDTKHLDRLLTCRKPVTGTSQLIHGDLTGNVLFDAVQPPAIIDMSPYWRPPEFATAIVVADALVWEGAGDELIDNASDTNDFTQYLLRALIYRIVTDRLARPTESPRPHAGDPYRRAVELACR